MKSLKVDTHRALITAASILLLFVAGCHLGTALDSAVALAIAPSTRDLLESTGAAVDDDVWVLYDDLIDSNGSNYGRTYFLSSNVPARVCVYPRIVVRENVNGTVTPGPVLLDPNESHFVIGSFNSADLTKPWQVDVAARWQRC